MLTCAQSAHHVAGVRRMKISSNKATHTCGVPVVRCRSSAHNARRLSPAVVARASSETAASTSVRHLAPPRITRILPGRGGIKFATARSPSPRPPRSRSPSPDPPPPSARTRAPSRPASASSPSAKKSSRDASPTRSATNPSYASKDASANPTKQTAKSSAGISTPPKPSRPSTRARCPKRTA